ncbi:MAG: GSCFA domain-containing protein [Roseovarius sp.]|uniref:GSCFA domain-containing protein n=1 Tax=Roseovarius sp. TaxID=1486281 RepID=UPI001B6A1808|nr:GSCFA domain-containing protein [Roseovarius sp.]MBQ0748922.1 GSCFA domain-containing protein [Roseovarius sp.]
MKPFDETVRDRIANKYNAWQNPKAGTPSERSAESRFGKDFFFVESTPTFKIARDSRVYTIGSCFARNVEQFLVREGVDVPTTQIKIDPEVYVSRPRFANTILNKYNPNSMAAEILRGIGDLEYPDRGIIALSPENYFDPQASHTGLMSRSQVDRVRDELDRASKVIHDCKVFLFTLGLTETWFDRDTGIAFNQINPGLMRPIRDRLGFKNVNVYETVETLSHAFSRLKECVPDAKVVITVSPVPLLNTFTSHDVVMANTYSKATLRCAAQMLAELHDYVDYFPSYEMVANSNRAFSWEKDQAHVSDAVVAKVIEAFLARYLDTGE